MWSRGCLLLIVVHLWLVSCATVGSGLVRSAPKQTRIAQFVEHQQRATLSRSRSDRLAAATQGRTLAETCVAETPTRAACYYYRAVFTGLYYAARVIGYQHGLRTMMADCHTLITLDPTYADAGAYRMLGEMFTQVPRTAMRPDSVTQDLSRAVDYLRKATALVPTSVENHLALCETYVASADWSLASETCAVAERLLVAERGDVYYPTWRRELRTAKKRLAQHGNST